MDGDGTIWIIVTVGVVCIPWKERSSNPGDVEIQRMTGVGLGKNGCHTTEQTW